MEQTQLDIEAAASFLALKVETLRKRRVRGNFPPPDGRIGASPWWWTSTLEPLREKNAS